MNTETGFLIFSDDFGEHPSSCQHIFGHINESFQCVWINTIGMRTPNLTLHDGRKIIKKLNKMFFRTKGTGSNDFSAKSMAVVQPPMLPFLNIPGVKKFNKSSVNRVGNRNLIKFGMKNPIAVVTAPNACEYIREFNLRKLVYYCVDDFSEWPGLNKPLVQKMEHKLIEQADSFIATSQKLFDKLSLTGKPVFLLTHGVDYNFFMKKPPIQHSLLDEIPKPIVGYFGLFDQRSDQVLIEKIASNMPEVSFVITGDVVTEVKRLKKLKNIFFTGAVPYKELPSMVNGWDMCMLPYKLNKLTDAIQPLKIKEYLSSHKPVISTPIKEVTELKKYLIIAGTVEEWREKILANIRGIPTEQLENRKRFLISESWSFKAKQFIEICINNTF